MNLRPQTTGARVIFWGFEQSEHVRAESAHLPSCPRWHGHLLTLSLWKPSLARGSLLIRAPSCPPQQSAIMEISVMFCLSFSRSIELQGPGSSLSPAACTVESGKQRRTCFSMISSSVTTPLPGLSGAAFKNRQAVNIGHWLDSIFAKARYHPKANWFLSFEGGIRSQSQNVNSALTGKIGERENDGEVKDHNGPKHEGQAAPQPVQTVLKAPLLQQRRANRGPQVRVQLVPARRPARAARRVTQGSCVGLWSCTSVHSGDVHPYHVAAMPGWIHVPRVLGAQTRSLHHDQCACREITPNAKQGNHAPKLVVGCRPLCPAHGVDVACVRTRQQGCSASSKSLARRICCCVPACRQIELVTAQQHLTAAVPWQATAWTDKAPSLRQNYASWGEMFCRGAHKNQRHHQRT